MPQDQGLFAGVFPVRVAGPCGDLGQEDVGRRAEQDDVVEVGVGVQLPLLDLQPATNRWPRWWLVSKLVMAFSRQTQSGKPSGELTQ